MAKQRTYWLYGKHAVAGALGNPEREVRRVLMTKNVSQVMEVSKAQIVEGKEIDKLVPRDAVHQGIAAEVVALPEQGIDDVLGARVLVILDQVTDPHNVGAILRSCAAFGAGAIIVQDKHAPQETGVMAKAASGALEHIPIIQVTNISKAMEELKENEFWCIGLDGATDKRIHEVHNYQKVALVLGAEGKGLRRLVAEHCDVLVSIPINDTMESLNVSNAASVALYELSRRGSPN